jgi:hypothetical protein
MTAPAVGPPPLCGKPSHRAGGGALTCPDCLAASVVALLRAGRPGMALRVAELLPGAMDAARAAGFDAGLAAGVRLGRTAARLERAKEAWAWLPRGQRHIGDVTRRKDHDAYQKALERLLRDLKVAVPDQAPAA